MEAMLALCIDAVARKRRRLSSRNEIEMNQRSNAKFSFFLPGQSLDDDADAWSIIHEKFSYCGVVLSAV